MKNCNKLLLPLILIFLVLIASSCTNTNNKKIEYYSNEENYIEATGTIDYVFFNDKDGALYLGFSDLSETFDDDCFKITGYNYSIIVEAFKERIEVGKTATFVTAPKYFGNGYVMPIVSLTIDDICLLEYEVGILNFLDWLKNSCLYFQPHLKVRLFLYRENHALDAWFNKAYSCSSAFFHDDLLEHQAGIPAAGKVDGPEAGEHQQAAAPVVLQKLCIRAQI